MRILVTGGAGFIGSHLVDRLLAEGHEVMVVDDLSTGKRENLNPRAEFYEVDIRDRASLEPIFAEGIDLVNHHAAQIDVRKSVADPAFDASVNVLGTLNLLELSVKYGVREFIFSSSGGVIYGDSRLERLPLPETAEKRPESPYGAAKLSIEYYLLVYNRVHGLPYAVLRYGNVYGPRQDPGGEAGVISIFTGQMLRGECPQIFGDGEQTRDYIYIGDVVEANIRVTERLAQPGAEGTVSIDDRAFNIGTGRPTSVNELYRRLAALLDWRESPYYAPPRPGELHHNALDGTKAEEILDFRPEVSLDEGLRLTASWIERASEVKER